MFKFIKLLFKDFYLFSAAYSNNSFPDPLSSEEEEKYIKLANSGDKEARSKLIEHNLRLVAHIVKKYDNSKEDSDDLIIYNNFIAASLPARPIDWTSGDIYSQGVFLDDCDDAVLFGNYIGIYSNDQISVYDTVYAVHIVGDNATVIRNQIGVIEAPYGYALVISGEDFNITGNMIVAGENGTYACGIEVDGPSNGVIDNNYYEVSKNHLENLLYACNNVTNGITNNNNQLIVDEVIAHETLPIMEQGGLFFGVDSYNEIYAQQVIEVANIVSHILETTDFEKETVYFDEYWVDPYCEKVWEYNVQVAKELIERGFDEIQFDYIRFPTDGTNLGKAKYRYQEKGMDMESALISFLSYARENIKAPIGIDIYGSNGWYRSGSRTGQDVELLSDYVDVICPMFYPNHFEQNFLAYQPEIERPYRIYYYGTYRNAQIARDKVLIRPWAQAFYLNVSYDRKYYNKDYVRRQIFGVRDSMNNGYMYWNNSGRYSDISPDILDTDPYPWVEGSAQ